MDISLVQVFYTVAIIFTIIVGSLLSIVLIKVIHLLNELEEFFAWYNKFKQVLHLYTQIPEIIFELIKGFLLGKK